MPLATLCLIWPALESNPRPPKPIVIFLSTTQPADFESTIFDLVTARTTILSYDFAYLCRMITISKDGSWRFFDTQIEYEKGQEPYLLHSGKIEVGNLSPTEHPCLITLSPDAKVAAISCFSSLAVFSTKTGENF